ncbi:hypothetical protein [Actinomadura parmotrematis]|uniref:Uncharacterized protein n=1 Tax=Actinomadura parmotrematis TaxID=2864039 RepID=A0ABS7G2J5_9ACTN|nr:hypothetical protein [Actinomadura parmotrematis]MBW8486701.1 hypothetical protein [Actinomadura parmotrematis]
MGDALGVLVGLVLLVLLVRRVAGGSGGGRMTIRFRVPLRHRFPRLWWSAVAFGLLVVLPVGLLADACGWWG